MKTEVSVSGLFSFRLLDENGSCVDIWSSKNFVTNAGRSHMADQMLSAPAQASMSHMAIGSGTGQSVASTTLATETARVVFDSKTRTGADNNEVTYVTTFPAGTGTGTVSEVGIFNAANGGTMLDYSSGFVTRSKGAGQSLIVTLRLLFLGNPAS